jgi:hypothetical protein
MKFNNCDSCFLKLTAYIIVYKKKIKLPILSFNEIFRVKKIIFFFMSILEF